MVRLLASSYSWAETYLPTAKEHWAWQNNNINNTNDDDDDDEDTGNTKAAKTKIEHTVIDKR